MEAQAKAELCEAIVAELEEHGHCTGTLKDHQGKLCLMGAGLEVLGGLSQMLNAFEMKEGQYKICEALGFDTPDHLFIFNDGQIVDQRVPAMRSIQYWLDDESPITFEDYTIRRVKVGAATKDTAIDYATKMAKHWREQG